MLHDKKIWETVNNISSLHAHSRVYYSDLFIQLSDILYYYERSEIKTKYT